MIEGGFWNDLGVEGDSEACLAKESNYLYDIHGSSSLTLLSHDNDRNGMVLKFLLSGD